MSTFEPGGHALATTPKAILEAAKASRSDFLFSVPAVIEVRHAIALHEMSSELARHRHGLGIRRA